MRQYLRIDSSATRFTPLALFPITLGFDNSSSIDFSISKSSLHRGINTIIHIIYVRMLFKRSIFKSFCLVCDGQVIFLDSLTLWHEMNTDYNILFQALDTIHCEIIQSRMVTPLQLQDCGSFGAWSKCWVTVKLCWQRSGGKSKQVRKNCRENGKREGITFKWQIDIEFPEFGREWQRLMDFCAWCD